MDDVTDRPRLAQGERLPDLRLADARTGRAVPLVAAGGRQVPVIVAVHGAVCDDCRAYLRRLSEAAAEIAAWDGRVLVVVPSDVDEAGGLADAVHPPFPVLADPEQTLWRRMRLEGAAVLVADPWGEVRYRHQAAAHDLPGPAELVDWAVRGHPVPRVRGRVAVTCRVNETTDWSYRVRWRLVSNTG